MRADATYVYCLVRSASEVSTAQAPAGLPGLAAPRPLAVADDLWLVVADAPLPEYGAEHIEARLDDLAWVSERAVAHEKVIEHMADAGTVLPLKLFTLFSSDERAVGHIVERRPQLERTLERVAGCVEWGVRVRFDADAARRAIASDLDSTGRPASGTDFLARKKASKEAAGSATAAARDAVDRIYVDLAGVAADMRRQALPPAAGVAPLLLDAAFLVPSDTTPRFEEAVESAARQLAEHHCEVTLTGPWPPYNFVDDGGSTRPTMP